RLDFATRRGVPLAHASVGRTRQEALAIGADRHTEYFAAVSTTLGRHFSGRAVPEARHTVFPGRGEVLTVRAEGRGVAETDLLDAEQRLPARSRLVQREHITRSSPRPAQHQLGVVRAETRGAGKHPGKACESRSHLPLVAYLLDRLPDQHPNPRVRAGKQIDVESLLLMWQGTREQFVSLQAQEAHPSLGVLHKSPSVPAAG